MIANEKVTDTTYNQQSYRGQEIASIIYTQRIQF